MDRELVKKELTRMLVSIFGENIKKTIEKYYDSENNDELIELAEHMLTGYMGEENAHKLLDKILEKTVRRII